MTRIAVADIDDHVLRLFTLVSDGLTDATTAFLEGDREMARALIAGDQSIDSLQEVTEELLYAELDRALEHNDGGIRTLVAALQIVPELERSGDLVEHIALRTQQNLATEISPLARALVGEMGRIGAEMWRAAATAYADHDATAADALRQRDDELDDLHVQLSVELAASGTSVPVAIEMGLVARFYERLGDHAVNVARRVSRLASSLEHAHQAG
ncbi:MAG TPA: PhoU domain-containing protein [Acidimicrobiales bacterium]